MILVLAVSFDPDRFVRQGGRLDTADIDFHRFQRTPLPAPALRCLQYMHDVEFHTSCYLRNLLNTKAHHDPDITTFLTIWNYEELWHGEALARVLAEHDQPAGGARVAAMRRRLGWRITASPIGWMAFSAVTPQFLAVHMTVGALNEWTTQTGYARLAQVAGHPVLTELLRRIMRQEGRHIDLYAARACAELEGSSAARSITRAVLRRMWRPVGARVMPRSELQFLAQTLFAGEDGQRAVRRIDERVHRLPGLDGLHLMRRAMDGYGAVAA